MVLKPAMRLFALLLAVAALTGAARPAHAPRSAGYGPRDPAAREAAEDAEASPSADDGDRDEIDADAMAPSAAGSDDDEDQRDGSDLDADDVSALAPNFVPDQKYVVHAVDGVAPSLTPPRLPDLSGYTLKAIEARLPHGPRAQTHIGDMVGEDCFKAFEGGDERLREWATRQQRFPKAIFIEHGRISPRELVENLPDDAIAETAPGVFVARLPIEIRPDAALIIGPEVREFRLSQDRGAFLVNDGKLFMLRSALVAWNEAAQRPARYTDKHDFRPFLLSWGGSETYIGASRIESLGYAASKSYGISISQYSPAMAPRLKRMPPTGWLIDSEIVDNWYGWYCYEADGYVLKGNRFHDNIKYGIDPHDRSRHLIIAQNQTWNTKEKHGIIVSREVNDSWIIDNESHDNALSGIVVDRSSLNDVVAHNKTYRNGGNGVTVYESSSTLIWQNLSTDNAHHGVYIRNSSDIRLYDNLIVRNGLSGVYGLVKDLSDIPRNFQLDPYKQALSLLVAGGQIGANGSGPIAISRTERAEFYNVELIRPQRELGIKLLGMLAPYQTELLDVLVRQRRAVVIEPVRRGGSGQP